MLQERQATALLALCSIFSGLSTHGQEDLARGNAVGRVDLEEEHARLGYISHPAVIDSCMHLGLFVGSPDGHTRVPGKPIQLFFVVCKCSNLGVQPLAFKVIAQSL